MKIWLNIKDDEKPITYTSQKAAIRALVEEVNDELHYDKHCGYLSTLEINYDELTGNLIEAKTFNLEADARDMASDMNAEAERELEADGRAWWQPR